MCKRQNHNNISFLFFPFCLHVFSQSRLMKTVFSPINGHSKRLTPLISGQSFFQRSNSGESLIKNLAFFSLQLADSPKFLETTIEKITKLNGFLSIYFKHLETLHSSSFFTASIFLINQFTSFSWP